MYNSYSNSAWELFIIALFLKILHIWVKETPPDMLKITSTGWYREEMHWGK